MRVLVEILRWKDENLKHENIQHLGFFLEGEHTVLKLNMKKKASEGQTDFETSKRSVGSPFW